jgi:hypothetical protein
MSILKKASASTDNFIQQLQGMSPSDFNSVFVIGDKVPGCANLQDAVKSGDHYDWLSNKRCMCRPLLFSMDENGFPWVIVQDSKQPDNLVLIGIDPADPLFKGIEHAACANPDDWITFSRDYEYKYHGKLCDISLNNDDDTGPVMA